MAKVIITIEDLPNDEVSVIAQPNFETMMKMVVSGHEVTSAQGYAVNALNSIRKSAKEEGRMKINVPRIERY